MDHADEADEPPGAEAGGEGRVADDRPRASNEGFFADDAPGRVVDDADADPEAGDGGETEGSVRGPHPFDPSSPLLEHWGELMDDVAATAEIYREEGWDVLELHPTDAAALTDAEVPGIEVTVPTNEFERLDSWVEGGRFGAYEVYRAETERVFLLVVARDETSRRAVCVPAHYGFESVSALADRADATGRFLTHVLGSDGERVTLTHDDPGPFFPGGGSGSSRSRKIDAERGGDGRPGGPDPGAGEVAPVEGVGVALPHHGFEIRNSTPRFVVFRRTYYDVPAPSV